ncbi:unnamed protein product [Trichobilharzia regenti]|nr:unnamed protein product [Trichobilharzia regenti]
MDHRNMFDHVLIGKRMIIIHLMKIHLLIGQELLKKSVQIVCVN